ncbi:MAG: hypothetical protein HZB50_15125 [Chloroflexi bacterium]|nr:hypothetical protein [Chloroflexota bacterium]
MTVRIGNMTFTDWVSLPFEEGWSDTFIFRISAQACLPPFNFRKPLKRLAAHTRVRRCTASIWIQVDSPGDWYLAELRLCLKGLRLPFAVTRIGVELGYLDFSMPLELLYSKSPPPPAVVEKPQPCSSEELRIIQALSRMEKGDADEVASLAGLSKDVTGTLLADLQEKKLVVYKTGMKIMSDNKRPTQLDLFPSWHILPKGASLSLRSWSIPKGVDFKNRKEENLKQIGTEHRRIARLWTAWLKTAYPRAEIWAGWSEVRIPKISVIPDGLAWGRIQGYESLFWLEVGDNHKGNEQITDVTTRRLDQARELCDRTGARLVYVQLSPSWVHEAAKWSCVHLPQEIAVVFGNWKKFGELPIVEWGRITMG